jgi:pentatricopeptide repeat protein
LARKPGWAYRQQAAKDAKLAARRREDEMDRWKPLPDQMHGELKQALVLMDAKKHGEAKEKVVDFLETRPGHRAGHAMLIRIHGKLGEIGLSEHLFDYAMKKGMECWEVYCGMVDAYASCGQFEKALQTIARAEERGMGSMISYLHLMAGLYTQKRYAEIEQLYNDMPAVYKVKCGIIVRYADALRKMKRYDEAVRVATLALDMRGTLGDKTTAKIVIAYSEIERGNHAKAYGLLDGIYGRLSAREDGGAGFRFYPRLLCGMVFACSRGGIPQPDSTIEHWRSALEAMQRQGRGKEKDVVDALTCLFRIPAPPAQQAL